MVQPHNNSQRNSRQARQMRNIVIEETSAVDFPAHGVPGWIVVKSADGSSKPVKATQEQLAGIFGTGIAKGADDEPEFPPGAFKLSEQESYLVSKQLEAIGNGKDAEFVAAGKGARLGKNAAGKPYMTTPDSVARAAGEQWAKDHNVGQRRI